jgi:hypothetical protein
MPLPLQKRKNSFLLTLSNSLYSPQSLEKSLEEFPNLAKKSRSARKKEYMSIKFYTPDLVGVLDFSNYILSLNR